MPGALVVTTRSVRHNNGHGGGEEVRRTRQRERSRGVVPQRLDHCRQKGLEADGADVRVVHEAEDPGAPVGQRLAQADPDAGRFLAPGGVGGDAGVGELALGFFEPAGL